MKQSAIGADEEAQSGRVLLGALDRMVDQLCQLLGRDAQLAAALAFLALGLNRFSGAWWCTAALS